LKNEKKPRDAFVASNAAVVVFGSSYPSADTFTKILYVPGLVLLLILKRSQA
jgi:hypothetical protein